MLTEFEKKASSQKRSLTEIDDFENQKWDFLKNVL